VTHTTHQTATLNECCDTFFYDTCGTFLKCCPTLVAIGFLYLSLLEVDDYYLYVDLKWAILLFLTSIRHKADGDINAQTHTHTQLLKIVSPVF